MLIIVLLRYMTHLYGINFHCLYGKLDSAGVQLLLVAVTVNMFLVVWNCLDCSFEFDPFNI